MTLPSSPNSISMQQIGNEFGFTVDSDTTSLGDYRTLANGSNYPQSIGALSFSSIDGGGSVATGNNPISMGSFRGTRLQQVVNFWSSSSGGFRLNAKSRYDNNGMIGSNNEVAVVGGYRTRPSNSSGTKVHIHVNQAIGSERFDPDHCALRTGSWDGSTTLQVDVGGSGRIQGAGGWGGDGAN